MAFVAAFDASGVWHDPDQPCLAVGGFVSSVRDWQNFSNCWKKRLDEEGITWFHMTDFAQCSGEFKNGWRENERRRRGLLRDLMEIIKCHAYRKFGCVVVNETFGGSPSKDMKDHYHLNAYSLAGRTTVARVSEWAARDRIEKPIKLVFADGDKGKGDLIARLNDDGYPTPDFEYPRDTVTKLGLSPGSYLFRPPISWPMNFLVLTGMSLMMTGGGRSTSLVRCKVSREFIGMRT